MGGNNSFRATAKTTDSDIIVTAETRFSWTISQVEKLIGPWYVVYEGGFTLSYKLLHIHGDETKIMASNAPSITSD